ncbi:GRB10-interacting GYF protein 2-like [Fundulus heteroclitus]|uniref:GRB10-interacting GYF protein 2-like n=1 Tax=Fundulus heteroclitus TaxID=8078 RepID=UPI00165AA215|nr:GRB10-interacting GYF protein 2-like [Fundulus heteroclitus]
MEPRRSDRYFTTMNKIRVDKVYSKEDYDNEVAQKTAMHRYEREKEHELQQQMIDIERQKMQLEKTKATRQRFINKIYADRYVEQSTQKKFEQERQKKEDMEASKRRDGFKESEKQEIRERHRRDVINKQALMKERLEEIALLQAKRQQEKTDYLDNKEEYLIKPSTTYTDSELYAFRKSQSKLVSDQLADIKRQNLDAAFLREKKSLESMKSKITKELHEETERIFSHFQLRTKEIKEVKEIEDADKYPDMKFLPDNQKQLDDELLSYQAEEPRKISVTSDDRETFISDAKVKVRQPRPPETANPKNSSRRLISHRTARLRHSSPTSCLAQPLNVRDTKINPRNNRQQLILEKNAQKTSPSFKVLKQHELQNFIVQSKHPHFPFILDKDAQTSSPKLPSIKPGQIQGRNGPFKSGHQPLPLIKETIKIVNFTFPGSSKK